MSHKYLRIKHISFNSMKKGFKYPKIYVNKDSDESHVLINEVVYKINFNQLSRN